MIIDDISCKSLFKVQYIWLYFGLIINAIK